MNYVKALFLKFGMTLLVLTIILMLFFDWTFTDVFLTSVMLAVLGYIGDLFIFRNIGNDQKANSDHRKRNIIGTVSDAPVAFLIVWLMGQSLNVSSESLLASALVSGLVIAAGEWFFHQYLDKNVFEEKQVTHG